MVVVVLAIIALSAPHLGFTYLEPSHASFRKNWVAFVGVILALSGVEAIANLTGAMTLDPKASANAPSVAITSKRATGRWRLKWCWAQRCSVGRCFRCLHSMSDNIKSRYTDMLRFLGEQYGSMALGPHFGHVFGIVVGLVVGLLLLSAVNTAVGAMIGLMYMLARDREMPRPFAKLNSHGVPWQPLLVAASLPIILVILADDLDSLADMYAIGVVGAITVNLGSSCFNKRLKLNWREFTIMVTTFVILFAIEITIAKTKPAALFFATCVLLLGFGLRWYAMKRAGIETVMLTREMAAALVPSERLENLRPNLRPANPSSWPRAVSRRCCASPWKKRACGRGVCTSSMSSNSPSICRVRWRIRSARVGRRIARQRKSCTGCLTWLKTAESKCCPSMP